MLGEVQDADDETYFAERTGPGRGFTWLHRGDALPGNTSLLEDAVRALPRAEGHGFWWFGGEAGTLRPIRRYRRRELGLHASTVECSGYWKRGVANHDQHAPVDPDDAE